MRQRENLNINDLISFLRRRTAQFNNIILDLFLIHCMSKLHNPSKSQINVSLIGCNPI